MLKLIIPACLLLQLSFSYDYIKKSLGAVDEEKGVKLGLIPNGIYINSKLYPSLIAVVDYGIALPIHHSSVWLRIHLEFLPVSEKIHFQIFILEVLAIITLITT